MIRQIRPLWELRGPQINALGELVETGCDLDRAASGDFLLVFPAGTVTGGGDTALLEAAGRLLWAEPWYTDDLYYLDTKFDHGEGVAEAWELLHSRVRR